SLTQRPCSSADDLHLSRQLDKHREVRRIARNCAQRHVETDCITAPAADFLYRSDDVEFFECAARVFSSPDLRCRFAQERNRKHITRSQALCAAQCYDETPLANVQRDWNTRANLVDGASDPASV